MDRDDFLVSEERNGFFVSEKRKKIWNIQLDLLSKIDEICDKYGLTYFAANGTLLGAVKYQGFIPWDDDMDIFMPRDDYDKFASVSKYEFDSPYYFQEGFGEEKYFRYYNRLRNADTTAISVFDMDIAEMSGIFIDIFPIDGINIETLRNQEKKINRYSKWIMTYVYNLYSSNIIKRLIKKVYINLLFSAIPLNKMKKKLLMVMKGIAYEKASYVSIYFHGSLLAFEKNIFEKRIYVNFENRTISIPVGYDCILKKQYGNYLETEPSDSEKGQHHNIFFDPEHSYSFYKNRVNKQFLIEHMNDY